MFHVQITGRCKKVLLRNPDASAVARGAPPARVVEDRSPMRIAYLSYRDCLLHATNKRLQRVSQENPEALITFPEGHEPKQMPLADWLKLAPTLPVPSEAAIHPERQNLELGEPHPSFEIAAAAAMTQAPATHVPAQDPEAPATA